MLARRRLALAGAFLLAGAGPALAADPIGAIERRQGGRLDVFVSRRTAISGDVFFARMRDVSDDRAVCDMTSGINVIPRNLLHAQTSKNLELWVVGNRPVSHAFPS